MNRVIDGGAALGGRLTWVHVAHSGARSQVRFYVDGAYAGTAAAEPTPETTVIGVDHDVVYIQYGGDIARFRRTADDAVEALDAVPVAGVLSA
ncbi:LppP/LprE family lipoprotein [Tsukamurella strandjordii]|uniref:LppP/LprE family lipoprotein n=1 Tax=Tsukamurella strandjordii TaxID=147577 RepID=A0AA90NCK3_9ACTN|nr:LppP/LprE family lipoprotein [Tsukamurella strandjordii]MDP0397917.1 LppP/LprE family lipoprotein [Tsukamurella strandjordii]